MTRIIRRWQIVVVGAILGLAIAAAEAAAGLAPDRALTAFLIVTGYSLVIAALQGRSETASLLAGNPVDERWRLINERAAVFMALVGTAVSLGGFIAFEFTGRDATGFGIVASAMGLAYLAGVGWHRAHL